jgi:hypothetical protein
MKCAELDSTYGNVINAEIAIPLNLMVRYAARVIAPNMGVDYEKLQFPRVVLGAGSYFYSAPPVTLCIGYNGIKKRKYGPLGEEVTHFLHCGRNPDVMCSDDPRGVNTAEFIGAYGRLIFSRKEHTILEPYRRMLMRSVEKLSPEQKSLLVHGELTEEDRIGSYETHEGGHRAAKFLIERFGVAGFRELSFMGSDETETFLETLGFRGSIFASWRSNEYTITDVKPDGRVVDNTYCFIGDVTDSSDVFKLEPASRKLVEKIRKGPVGTITMAEIVDMSGIGSGVIQL